MKKISFIIVNFNQAELTLRCVRALFEHLSDKVLPEVILVDNASSPEDLAALKEASLPGKVTLFESPENVGFGKGCNLANASVTGDYVVYLNNDAFLTDDSLIKGIELLDSKPEAGLVGAALVDESGNPQFSFGSFRYLRVCLAELLSGLIIKKFKTAQISAVDKRRRAPFEIDYPLGAFMLLRRSEFVLLGGFDPRFFMYFEENDLARRLRYGHGFKALCHPGISIVHLMGATQENRSNASRRMHYQSFRKYLDKYHGFFYRKALKTLLLLIHFKRMALNRVYGKPAEIEFNRNEARFTWANL